MRRAERRSSFRIVDVAAVDGWHPRPAPARAILAFDSVPGDRGNFRARQRRSRCFRSDPASIRSRRCRLRTSSRSGDRSSSGTTEGLPTIRRRRPSVPIDRTRRRKNRFLARTTTPNLGVTIAIVNVVVGLSLCFSFLLAQSRSLVGTLFVVWIVTFCRESRR